MEARKQEQATSADLQTQLVELRSQMLSLQQDLDNANSRAQEYQIQFRQARRKQQVRWTTMPLNCALTNLGSQLEQQPQASGGAQDQWAEKATVALRKRVRILEAQNEALRTAQEQATHRGEDADQHAATSTAYNRGFHDGEIAGKQAAEVKFGQQRIDEAEVARLKHKLKQAVDTLRTRTTTISELQADLEAAQSTASNAQGQLAQARQQLRKQKRSTQDTATAPQEPKESTAKLQHELFTAQTQVDDLRTECKRMRAAVTLAEQRAAQASEAADDRLMRLERWQATAHAAQSERQLRSEIVSLMKRVDQLSDAALDRDAELLEARIQAEAAEAAASRLQRRGLALSSSETVAAHNSKGMHASDPSRGDAGRKQDDLQRVVEATQAVVQKQRAEIARLRQLRQISSAENKALDDLRSQYSETAAELRKQVEECDSTKAQLSKLRDRVDSLSKDCATKDRGIKLLEQQLHSAASGSASDREVQSLRKQLRQSEVKLESVSKERDRYKEELSAFDVVSK